MSHAITESGLSKAFTIKLNADQNRAYTANSLVKLSAIEIRSLGSNLTHINGFSSRGKEIKNFGFEIQSDPHLLRDIGRAMLNMADEISRHKANTVQQKLEDLEVELFDAGYTIENCAEYKGQYYFYFAADNFASVNFHARHLAIAAAHADHKMSPEERKKNRI